MPRRDHRDKPSGRIEPGTMTDLTGTVQVIRKRREHCVLWSDDGKLVELLGLPKELQSEGLRIKVTVRPDPDSATLHLLRQRVVVENAKTIP